MSGGKKRHEDDDGIIFLETEERDAVTRALREAERAIENVEERNRHKLEDTVPAGPPAGPAARTRPADRRAGGRRQRGGRARPPGPRRARGDEGARDPGRGRGGEAARGAPAQVGGLRQPQAPHREGEGRLLQVRPRGRLSPAPRCAGQLRTGARAPAQRTGTPQIPDQIARSLPDALASPGSDPVPVLRSTGRSTPPGPPIAAPIRSEGLDRSVSRRGLNHHHPHALLGLLFLRPPQFRRRHALPALGRLSRKVPRFTLRWRNQRWREWCNCHLSRRRVRLPCTRAAPRWVNR